MKGLILSGGKGTRLRPITHTSAKQLIPIANKPVLFYAVEAVVAAGIEEIGIIVGDTAREVRSAVGDGSTFGARVTYIQQEAPLGLAHAVNTARDFVGDDRFVVFLGDNLIRDGITTLVDEFRELQPDAMILLARVPEPQRFGVAELENGRIVRLVEKPPVPPSDLALVGVYLFSPIVFDAISRISPSPRGEQEITDAIQRLIDDGATVVPHLVSGWWKDTGRLEDLLEANRIILDGLERQVDGLADATVRIEGKVVIEEGAELGDCVVRGPAIIGRNAVIEDAYIGPFTSIGPRCDIRHAEIEHSIVLSDSRIHSVHGKIESSLLGKECEVYGVARRPRALKLMLSDHSRLELP
jgi:glucose-1-phosphate thymidylyltransferase